MSNNATVGAEQQEPTFLAIAANPWHSSANFSITLESGQTVEVKFIPGLEGERRMHQFDLTGPVSPTRFQSHFVPAAEAETMATPYEYGTQFARLVAADFVKEQQAKEGKQKRAYKKGEKRLPLAAPPPATNMGDSSDRTAVPESSGVSEPVEAATGSNAIAQVQIDLTELTGQATSDSAEDGVRAAGIASTHWATDSGVDLVSGPVESFVIQPAVFDYVFDYGSLDLETRIAVQQCTEQIKERIRRTAQNILEIGQKLIEVKERLGHGKFGDWLRAEFDWSDSAATKFMQVARQFKSVNFTNLNFAPSALYLLAAPSTPTKVRQQILDRAKHGEVITYAKAKKAVVEAKTTPQEASKFSADRSQATVLCLGDWVEVHSSQGNKDWDGLCGPIVEPEDEDGRFGVDLSEASGQSEWKCVRFSMQELIKVPVPPPYKVGQIVMIKCDRDAEQHQRKHDGCWGIVREVLDFTVIVAVGHS
jgi:hypothetical protein